MSDETQVSDEKRLTKAQVEEALKRSAQSVQNYMKDGSLPYHKESNRLYFYKSDVEKLKANLPTQGRPKGGRKPASPRNPSNVGNLVDELEEAALRVLRLAAELRVRVG